MRNPKPTLAIIATLLASALMAACTTARTAREPDETNAEPMLATAGVAHVTVAEAFVTPATPEDNVDSPALWVGRDGQPMLLATAKKTSRLMVYDGDTGAAIGHRGSVGSKPGQFNRPNGIFVADDLLFVVERDNRRVQVLRLPGFEPIGSFGEGDLKQPYGMWLRATAPGRYDALVTDAYMDGPNALGEDITPPPSDLGARLKRYALEIDATGVRARLDGTVGDTSEDGAIRIPESVWGDVMHERLLIAEEDTVTGTALREYGLDGRYRGRTIGRDLFKAQAEGIALWSCTDGSGYWIATDQFKDRSLFHVFDRQTLRHLGAFAGKKVGNTDGIWLHAGATKRFPQGVFYAVHDDMAVGAFDWRDIARALSLDEHCPR